MKRTVCLLALALLTMAACTTADPAVDTGGSTTTTSADGSLQPPATTDDGTPVDTAPGATGTTPSNGGGSADTTPASAPATTEPVTAAPPAPGGVGSYAPFYLRPGESATITVEALSTPGAEPDGSTLEHVRSRLAAVSGKTVQVVTGEVGGGEKDWTAAELRALADQGRAQSRDASVLRLYFLKGTFDGDDGVLGIAVRSDMTAVFSDQVSTAAGLVGDRSRIERAVALHEVGHVLGLVDLHLKTGREDPEHPGHSTSQNSVMYWAVESSLVGQLLSGGPPTDFDEADLADLATIRNR